MGKMTDALRKARLLKEEKRRGRAEVSAESEVPVVPKAAPAPDVGFVEVVPPAAPTPAAVPPEHEPAPQAPEGPLEPAPPTPATEAPLLRTPPEERSAPTVSVVLPAVEPADEPPPAAAPAVETVLPDLEPTPVEMDSPFLTVHYHREGRTADEFRGLKNRLTADTPPARVILVTSCVGGEGKTTVATNLAVSFANTYGEKVVLVDGNIVRPKITELLKLPEDGLVQVVRGHRACEDAVVKTDIPGLWALSAGRPDGRTEGLLDSKPVAELLNWLRRRFTRVVVELPPLSDTGEGLGLFALADVVLIPVMKRRTRRRRLRRLLARAANHGAARVHCVFIEA